MSEEEIIKILNSYTTDLYHSYKGDVILKAIKGLLDLYNKEKEKNKELIKKYMEAESIKFWNNYISKDKIKEKIKEWDKGIAWANADDHYYAIKILQDLLEEE